MKRLGKYLLITIVVLVLVLAVGISATIGWRPVLGPRARAVTDRKFERTPQRLERGRYLVNAVTLCLDCHSQHDWTKPGLPVVAGTEGSGEVMPVYDLPGRIVASNITADPETGAGNWSDDQLARAIREGIGNDGRALFPMMPYEKFRNLSDEDLASIIVYVRSLPGVRHALPKTEIIFPVKYLIRSVPEPLSSPVPEPDLSTPLRRGKYLMSTAPCSDCHTPAAKGAPLPGMEYAGGFELPGPWGDVVSTNITPDDSGISYYDEALFLQVMRTGYVRARKLNEIMPVAFFKGMTDDDLKAIFAYLRTVKPVHHRVDNSEQASLCKLCRQRHGAGGEN